MKLMELDITHTYSDHYCHEKKANKYCITIENEKKIIYYNRPFTLHRNLVD